MSTGAVLPGTRFRAPTGPGRSSDELAASVTSVVDQAVAGTARGRAAERRRHRIGRARHRGGRPRLPAQPAGLARLPAAASWSPRRVDAPVQLRMDGLCITLAEHWVGAARGYDNVMGMVVSTGIGGGLILHGNTVSGPTGNAGHIGHVEVAGFDDPCPCGGIGCVEAIASGPRRSPGRAAGLDRVHRRGLDASYAAATRSPRPPSSAPAARSARPSPRRPRWSTSRSWPSAAGSRTSPPTCSTTSARRSPTRRQFGFVTKVRVVPSGLSGDGPLIGAAALIHRAEAASASRSASRRPRTQPSRSRAVPLVFDHARTRENEPGDDRRQRHDDQEDERHGPPAAHLVQHAEQQRAERGDGVADALHEAAERDRALVGAGPALISTSASGKSSAPRPARHTQSQGANCRHEQQAEVADEESTTPTWMSDADIAHPRREHRDQRATSGSPIAA